MIYPGYQLNPGDMFQVEPERVLFATGARKDKDDRRASRKLKTKLKAAASEAQTISEPAESADPVEPADPAEPNTSEPAANTKETLLALREQVKAVLASPTTISSAKRKTSLRAFQRLLKTTLSKPSVSTTLTDSLDAQLLELTSQLNISPPTSSPPSADAPPVSETDSLSPDERRLLRQALAEAMENPIDLTKPYATPWRPRPYMSAFAFVPRYLEVHHRICSAVYLRHPVARPGMGEVPTPFPAEVNALAFNWYLRRR